MAAGGGVALVEGTGKADGVMAKAATGSVLLGVLGKTALTSGGGAGATGVGDSAFRMGTGCFARFGLGVDGALVGMVGADTGSVPR